MNFSKKTFCSLLFNGWDSREQSPCCYWKGNRYKNFEHMQDNITKVQQDSIQGRRSEPCNACFAIEDSGTKSHRQYHLPNDYQGFTQQEFDNYYKSDVTDPKIKHLIIDTGLNCNFACRTCSIYSSTGWWKEHREKTGYTPTKSNHPVDPNLDYLLDEDLSSVRYVSVLGGEPFLDQSHIKILEVLPSDCTIAYTTNGGIPLSAQLKHHLHRFDNVQICFSIDAVGQPFDYIRTNGHWPQVEANMQDIKNCLLNAEITFSTVISALNVVYYKDNVDWIKENYPGSSIYINPALWQPYYTLNIFTPTEKDAIRNYLDNSDTLAGVVNLLDSSKFDQSARDQFFREIEWTRNYKKLDVAEYLPRLWQLLEK